MSGNNIRCDIYHLFHRRILPPDVLGELTMEVATSELEYFGWHLPLMDVKSHLIMLDDYQQPWNVLLWVGNHRRKPVKRKKKLDMIHLSTVLWIRSKLLEELTCQLSSSIWFKMCLENPLNELTIFPHI